MQTAIVDAFLMVTFSGGVSFNVSFTFSKTRDNGKARAMSPSACATDHTFSPALSEGNPLMLPFISPFSVTFAKPSPAPINEYVKDMIAATTESHFVF
nr:hypothetical protein Iba_chr03cCG10300 [Ipomoea batatas]GME02817.1 hypothetical protein Iba_scaffold156.2CG0600 [Ipomoea batatas]